MHQPRITDFIRDVYESQVVFRLLSIPRLDHGVVQCVEVPRDGMRDIHVTPDFFTDIQRIEVDYTQEEADGRKTIPLDILLDVYVDSLSAKALLPTPVPGPSCSYFTSTSSQVQGVSTSP